MLGRPGKLCPARGAGAARWGSPTGLPTAEGAATGVGGERATRPRPACGAGGGSGRGVHEGREAAPGPSPQGGGRRRMRAAGGGDGPALHAGAGER